jgi:hypothetical protein
MEFFSLSDVDETCGEFLIMILIRRNVIRQFISLPSLILAHMSLLQGHILKGRALKNLHGRVRE